VILRRSGVPYDRRPTFTAHPYRRRFRHARGERRTSCSDGTTRSTRRGGVRGSPFEASRIGHGVNGSDEIAGRVRSRDLRKKVCSAEDAAAMIAPGSTVGMSGFTGSGYPKVVPAALADRITEARDRGAGFSVSVWTGASTAPELDGLLAAADGIDLRMPYQADPITRAKINAGAMGYLDVHLSHAPRVKRRGGLRRLASALQSKEYTTCVAA